MFRAINPLTGETVRALPLHGEEEVERRLDAARHAAIGWADSGAAERAALLLAVAGVLDRRREELAQLAVEEMGKPVTQARAEVEKCALVCRYYAEHAADWLRDETIPTDARRSGVHHAPLGVVLAIMPWNFPWWQLFRCAAPAIAAGNAVLLKHAPNVPGCALAIEDILRDAGAPHGLLATLLVDTDTVARCIADDRVAAVTLTGSERAGRSVARSAGEALKPCVLELGGSDPFLVLEGADLDAALDTAVQSRTQNNGQSCIAAKRFLVHEDLHEAFLDGLVQRMDALVVGDPAREDTDIGPLVHRKAVDTLLDQVRRSVAAGARLRLGGEPPGGPAAFFPPTVLDHVQPGMPAFDEELFGPVAPVTPVRDTEHAVQLANRSRYGLGATVFAAPGAGEALIPRLRCGHVSVGGMVKSDPRLPFGGVGASGFGRELARDGLLAFVNRKAFRVD
ncbi:MAG: NAD-dependent succinate-semialdehyde dehydrogenase [Deltaproteobacteria bacterium]|nr:MAG: NAD-dependent succinate-semialdehyde dehydrogenase [Deltaproteobacteria bacterium]